MGIWFRGSSIYLMKPVYYISGDEVPVIYTLPTVYRRGRLLPHVCRTQELVFMVYTEFSQWYVHVAKGSAYRIWLPILCWSVLRQGTISLSFFSLSFISICGTLIIMFSSLGRPMKSNANKSIISDELLSVITKIHNQWNEFFINKSFITQILKLVWLRLLVRNAPFSII